MTSKTPIPEALRTADRQAKDRERRRKRLEEARRTAARERFADSGLTAAELEAEHRRLKVEFLQRDSARKAA